jgi:hypothetical protein
MPTTLDLDADILQAVKDIASAKGTTVGRVISDLVRRPSTHPVRLRFAAACR